MKTQSIIKTVVMGSAIALIVTSCKKESITVNPAANPATIAAIQGTRTSYNSAKMYNDSLNYWYNMDSTQYIGMMNHCDSLYHYCDSIMMSNYNMMNSSGGMMNAGGGMMNSGTSNGGMMNGGSTNSGSTNGGMMGGSDASLNCTINGNNCTVMITSLHQQHIHHPTQ